MERVTKVAYQNTAHSRRVARRQPHKENNKIIFSDLCPRLYLIAASFRQYRPVRWLFAHPQSVTRTRRNKPRRFFDPELFIVTFTAAEKVSLRRCTRAMEKPGIPGS